MESYAFDQVIPIFGAVPLSGFAEGDDVITVARRVDLFTLTVGADGHGVASRSADLSGEITLKLLQTSLSHAYLSTLLQVQEAGRFISLPFLLKDVGTMLQLVAAPHCVIQKPADQPYGAGVNIREWTLLAEAIEMF